MNGNSGCDGAALSSFESEAFTIVVPGIGATISKIPLTNKTGNISLIVVITQIGYIFDYLTWVTLCCLVPYMYSRCN